MSAIASFAGSMAVVVCRPAEKTGCSVVEPELMEVLEADSEDDCLFFKVGPPHSGYQSLHVNLLEDIQLVGYQWFML